MRILHCVESYYPAVGGMPEVVRRLSEGLVHLGHEVTVATSHMQNRQSDFLNGIRIVSFTLAGRLADGIVGDPTEQRKYQEFIADPHFEVVVFFAAQQWSCDLALPVLHSITAKKVFVPTGFSGLHLPVFQDYYSLMPNWLLKYDMNVFLSNDYQDINFARAYGVKKYMIIPNGASEKEFLKIRDYDFRRDKSLPENSKILLLVGSHTGEKGHYEAIKILQKLQSKNIVLVIAANTPEGFQSSAQCQNLFQKSKQLLKAFLSVFIRRYRIQRRCPQGCEVQAANFNNTRRARREKKWLFIESFPREKVVALYQQADLFLFPSNIECSPIVLFEALAGKTPFLASSAGNSAEIADWTKGGLIIPSVKDKFGRTQVNMAAAVKMTDALLSDEAARERLTIEGHLAWQNKFTWEKIVQQYADLYTDLVEQGAK